MLNPVHIVHTGKHKIAQAETDESSDPPFIFNRGGLPKVCTTEFTICMLLMLQLTYTYSFEPKW